MTDYRPEQYWSERLERAPGLRGTGHIQYSEGYNEWVYRRKGDVLRQELRRLLPRERALDVGSGVGWVVEQLHRSGVRHVDGCDIAAAAVEQLQSRFPDDRFFTAAIGADRLPVDDGTYDLLTMLDVSYHITDDDLWEQALGELARVAGPWAALVLIDTFGEKTVAPSAHVRFRSLEMWRGALEAVGFRAERPPVAVYRWLSRSKGDSVLRHLPDRARGPIEYGLDRVAPYIRPHMRCLVAIKHGGGTP